MALGICSVSYKSCQHILRSGPGASLTIVVGGAAESLSAHPGTADLTLKRRLGFIKLAIREGADLVPVFSFGENDVRAPGPLVESNTGNTAEADLLLMLLRIARAQLFAQLANPKGTKLYKLQKQFQRQFGFTLRKFSLAPHASTMSTRLMVFCALSIQQPSSTVAAS